MTTIAVCRNPRTFLCVLASVGLFGGIPSTAAADQAAPVTYYHVPTGAAGLQGVAAAPDGSIWFTERAADKIGELTSTGAFNELAIPTAASEPTGIAVASDGSIWFTESAADKIGELTSTGSLTEYTVPTAASEPNQITIGPDGDPWFTETAGDQIGTVRGGVVVEYPIPTPDSEPEGITTSDAGTIWFAEAGAHYAGTISMDGTITERQLPTGDGVSAVATDTAGNLWLIQPSSNPWIAPGVIQFPAAASYSVGESFLPQGSAPSAVAVGPDGAAWFSEAGTGQIARITYTGVGGISHQYDTGGSPQDIVAGPGNTLWFTDPNGNAIGRIDLTLPSFSSPPTVTLTPGQTANVSLTTSGFPAPTLGETGSLPRGLRFTDNGNGTGTLSGTALAADAGRTFPVTLTANSGLFPAASQTLSIAIARSTAPAISPAKPRRGKATAGRPHVRGKVVAVTVACRGKTGQTCAITARLTARGASRRASTRVVARHTLTLAAGHRRTVRLGAGRAASRSAHGLAVVMLTIVQHEQRAVRTLRHQSIAFARS